MRILILLTLIALIPTKGMASEICQQISRVCAEGPETRTIDEVDVYRDCWRYTEEYYCRSEEQINTCQGLNSVCQVTGERCLDTDPSGFCTLSEKIYTCGQLQPDTAPATHIESTYTIVKDELNDSACQSLEDNSSCQITGNICTEKAETRIINGKSVYKSCWAWEKQYVCSTDTYSNFCSPLETLCDEVSSKCESRLGDGTCVIETKTYDCDKQQPVKEGITFVESKYSITGEKWDGTCKDENPECVVQNNVCVEEAETRVINGMPVYRDCWRYEKTLTCLSGDMTTMCSSIDQKACTQSGKTCVSTSSDGTCVSYSIEYTCTYKYDDTTTLNCGSQMFCLGEDCYDTGYQPNNEFGLAAAYLGAALASGDEITETSIDVFSGHKSTCSKFAASTVDCCDDSGWANGSVSGCSNTDLMLIEERKNKLTHYIGTYCHKKLKPFNTCIEYRESYCTFSSMLARIVQEGARPQLGRGWGSAKNPSCAAMTPEDFKDVDFTKIDFSEYINSMSVGSISEEELAKKVQDKINAVSGGK
ncbi:conjugal transfer protein TraN [Vibrio vulnificus]|uniref:conjugal transfer protein TraN n=1 Tax=Vibrio vulnificus TaxID=672 RepID=UPI0010233526|nr:conjugal transfer protein TraN [Vibrio vulnificus]RZQ33253.1 hypothetical protein D8T38_18595 [Vibrio vulnificus]